MEMVWRMTKESLENGEREEREAVKAHEAGSETSSTCKVNCFSPSTSMVIPIEIRYTEKDIDGTWGIWIKMQHTPDQAKLQK